MATCDDRDPILNLTLNLPYNYALSAHLRPSSVRRTALMLAPWAFYMVLPKGRARGFALGVATRISPLARPSIKARL